MKMNNMILKFTLVGMLALISACSSGTRFQDVSQNTLTSAFSAVDQRELVERLVQQLREDDFIVVIVGSDKTLLVDEIKNKTAEQIDTESITDTLKSQILRMRLFRIISRDKIGVLKEEAKIAESELSDSNKATQIGKLWGANYVLYGNFSALVNFVDREKITYYKLTLIIQNVETGEEIWIGESDLNKVTSR